MICAYCKREMISHKGLDGHLSGLEKTRDHYIPLSRGGLNVKENIKHACYRCNNLKGSKMPSEWVQFMQNNPLWWVQTQEERKIEKTGIGTKPRKRLTYAAKTARAPALLKALREDPEYIPVPLSYEDPFAQLCYEVAMQNPHRIGRPIATKKASPAAFKRMTADENARRIREYWKRIAGRVAPELLEITA